MAEYTPPTPMDPSEWAIKAAYVKALELRAEQLRAELKEAVVADTDTTSLAARLPDGREVATVVRKTGYTTRRVGRTRAEQAAFLAYVADRYPDEVELTVNPGFRRQMLALARTQVIPGVVSAHVADTFEVKVCVENLYDEISRLASENPDFAAIIDSA